ncbi:hypothetical protein [Winogradskya humida]|uniref:Uncharacterized protein n=1 Tax=Winogradskya humida TaxID=113566 RepID=A0ABQ3ZYF5_9ACTN|nr:hypothetical protein [Actinoplanes humidus]GIE23623.1 hypothetical protein Ahu01nite_067250 [Actinoplanes humidus]
MPKLTVHDFADGWTSTDPDLLAVTFTPHGLRLSARSGAAGAAAVLTPPTPLDLGTFDELRLRVSATDTADGSPSGPFLLGLSYQDADGEHGWLVPVNRADTGEQHRFGIAEDERGRITRFTLRALTDIPFTAEVGELLAVHEDVLADVETALVELLAALNVPVVVEEEQFTELPDPVLLVTLTDQREDPERGWNVPQRDSFRIRGDTTVCSVRPAARPVLAEYQVLPAASDRATSLALRGEILRRIGLDTGLRVNGEVLPVQTLLPPPLDIRVRAVPAPIYLHIGARIEQGPRVEVPWPRRIRVLAGQRPADQDQEGIVLRT